MSRRFVLLLWGVGLFLLPSFCQDKVESIVEDNSVKERIENKKENDIKREQDETVHKMVYKEVDQKKEKADETKPLQKDEDEKLGQKKISIKKDKEEKKIEEQLPKTKKEEKQKEEVTGKQRKEVGGSKKCKEEVEGKVEKGEAKELFTEEEEVKKKEERKQEDREVESEGAGEEVEEEVKKEKIEWEEQKEFEEDEEEMLLKRSREIEKEIDALLKEAHRLFSQLLSEEKKKETFLPVASWVTTPQQVIEKLISPEKRKCKMNLEFEKANLEDVLRTIGEAGEFNIVLDPALKGKKVDIHLKNVTIEEALNLLYSAYDLGSYQIGDSLFVSSRQKIKAGTLVTKMIKLENVSVSEAKGLIEKLVEIINLSEETNTMVIVGTPEDTVKAESILKEVDIPQPQVLLEAKIIEVNTDALKELGIDWSDSIKFAWQESKRQLAVPVGSPFRIYRLSRGPIYFETTLRMLIEQNKAKVLSNPRITTLSNKEAEIFIGDKIPYTVTTVTGGVATTEVRFVEPGIRLKITPSIIEKDFVVIKVQPEVSYIYGWRGPNDEYPWVRTRESTAYVRVKNRQPFVLGGLLAKEKTENVFKVPLLGDLPVLGALFQYKKHKVKNSELIITVIPTIITGE